MAEVGVGGVIAIVLYMAVTVLIGLMAARRVKGMRDYMIAGEGFGKWLVAFGVTGAIVSGAALLGNAGSGYGTGYALHVMTMGMSILGLVVAYFMLAKPMTVASKKFAVYTLPDLLALRYSDSTAVRFLSAVGLVCGCFIYLVVQFVAIAWVGTTIFGWSQELSLLIGGGIVALYTVGGGVIASVWTNIFQMSVLSTFAVGIAIWTVHNVGGLTQMHSKLATIDPQLLEPWHADGAFVWQNVLVYGLFVGLLAYAGVPHVSTRFLTIRNLEVIRWLPLISIVLYLMGTMGTWAGLGYRVMVEEGTAPPVDEPDAVLPTMIMEYFPPVMVGILVAAVFAAVMSTTDSFMVLIGACVTRDVFKNCFKVRMTDRTELTWSRICSLVLLILAGALALNPPEFVLGLMAVAWGALAAMLGPVLYVGMRWRRATKQGAIAALVVGIVIGGVIGVLNELVFVEEPLFAPWNVASIGVGAGFVAIIVVSLLTPHQDSRLFAHFKRRSETEEESDGGRTELSEKE